MTLQWATYRDAADQTSLSRIWGGIHPPFDDIPGRKIGILVAADAVRLAERYFNGTAPPPPRPRHRLSDSRLAIICRSARRCCACGRGPARRPRSFGG